MVLRAKNVGQRIKRREDPRLIRGLATYTDDIKLPGMLHAAFVRSDHPAGRIQGIDASRALARNGVVAVFSGEDLRGQVGGVPAAVDSEVLRSQPHPVLADGVVRYVGQPVAVVIARDRYLARDGALEVEVDVSPRAAVTDSEAALEPEAPKVYEEFPDNVCLREVMENEQTEGLFAEADGSVALRLVNQRLAPVPMEPRAVLAHWDEGPQKLTIWLSTQTPHWVKQHLSICLGIPEIRIRVIAPEVGGGFGCKIPVYPEECLLSWVSRKLRRPVKWAETRIENLMSTTHGRDHIEYVECAYRKDGELLALRGKTLANNGAYVSLFGPSIALLTPAMVTGCYRIKAVSWETIAVYTNTMAIEAYRGAGRPEAAYIIERVIDTVARELELDPAEIRRRNFIPRGDFPYTTPTGMTYDTGDYELALDKALDIFGYAAAREAQEKARAGGRLVGIGFSTFTECSGMGPSTDTAPPQRSGMWEGATLRVEPTGNVTVLTGISPHGQGQETAFAQMVADALGIGIDDVAVLHGDTDVVQHGVGTFGSRGLVLGGTAVQMALDKIVAKARRIAAHLLDARAEEVDFENGEFVARASERRMSFRHVAEAAHLWRVPIPGEEPGLEAVARFEPADMTYPFGAHICQVEVERETGQLRIERYVAVDDFGNVVNPLLADGQRLGGIVQGLGQALCEEVRYDEGGQLVTATLMDYAIPKAGMFPRIQLANTVTTTPLNPLGAKGVGELGTIGATPCLVNAVLDALAPLGVKRIDMPLTPERLWRAIQEARS